MREPCRVISVGRRHFEERVVIDLEIDYWFARTVLERERFAKAHLFGVKFVDSPKFLTQIPK